MEVVDAHQHVGSLINVMGGAPEGGGATISIEEEQKNRVRRLKQSGIDRAVIQPAHGYLKPNGHQGHHAGQRRHRRVSQAEPGVFPHRSGYRRAYSRRAQPGGDRPGEARAGLERTELAPPIQGCFIDNKWMRPILRRMADLDLVPFVHTNAESGLEAPWRLQVLAQEFLQLTFVALDAFFTHGMTNQLLNTADHTPNIIWDAGGPTSMSIDEWVSHHGSESVTFSIGPGYADRGTPKRPPLLDSILESSMSEVDKGNNLRRLFGMPLESCQAHRLLNTLKGVRSEGISQYASARYKQGRRSGPMGRGDGLRRRQRLGKLLHSLCGLDSGRRAHIAGDAEHLDRSGIPHEPHDDGIYCLGAPEVLQGALRPGYGESSQGPHREKVQRALGGPRPPG